MTPHIEKFLAEHRPQTPCLVVDLDVVEDNYHALKNALPRAEIYYAVKANPASQVLDRLAGLGSNFDVASISEVDRCLASGVDPERIAFGNTVKKQDDIATAFAQGVRLFAFDSATELEKLAVAAPGAKVFCRILVENGGAQWPLSRKFGCSARMAADLMIEARDKGLVPYGLSFHVGSQQTDPLQWQAAIGDAAMIFTTLGAAGIELGMIDLGGGFPIRYRDDVPDIQEVADTIMDGLVRSFGNRIPTVMIEPGRYLTATAGLLRTEVVLISSKDYGDDVRWVYLDVGKFGGLAETMDEAIKYPIRTLRDGDETGPVAVAGPTCDGADILYEKSGYRLPLSLKVGDQVDILNTGAYTTTYSSVGFNGFPPLKEFYL